MWHKMELSMDWNNIYKTIRAAVTSGFGAPRMVDLTQAEVDLIQQYCEIVVMDTFHNGAYQWHIAQGDLTAGIAGGVYEHDMVLDVWHLYPDMERRVP